MPLHEYQRRSCGKTFEMLRRMKDADTELECRIVAPTMLSVSSSTFAAGGCGTSGSRGFTWAR